MWDVANLTLLELEVCLLLLIVMDWLRTNHLPPQLCHYHLNSFYFLFNNFSGLSSALEIISYPAENIYLPTERCFYDIIYIEYDFHLHHSWKGYFQRVKRIWFNWWLLEMTKSIVYFCQGWFWISLPSIYWQGLTVTTQIMPKSQSQIAKKDGVNVRLSRQSSAYHPTPPPTTELPFPLHY